MLGEQHQQQFRRKARDFLTRSTRFYSAVLGMPIDPLIHHEHLYWFQLPNGTDLILDSKIQRPEEPGYPLFYLGTTDIDGAYRILIAKAWRWTGRCGAAPSPSSNSAIRTGTC